MLISCSLQRKITRRNIPGKKWEEFAYATRKKYYYQAQRDFEKRTGKPAYSQAPGNMKFKDYFLQMTEEQKRHWLGKGRYELWKNGNLDLEKFIPPFPDRAFTVKELKEMDKRSFNPVSWVKKSKISKKGASPIKEKAVSKHRKEQLDRAKQNRAEREANMIGAKMIDGKHLIEDDLRAVNPKFDRDKNGIWENNCQRCVTAYEARRRGIDVVSKPTLEGDIFQKGIDKDGNLIPTGWSSAYKNPKLTYCGNLTGENSGENVIRQMEQWGDGSRAIVRIKWDFEKEGHVFFAENINGKIYFVDPQSNNNNVLNYFNGADSSKTYLMRVDNLKFSDIVNETCKPRETK